MGDVMRRLILFGLIILFAVPVQGALIGVNIAEKLDGDLKVMVDSENSVMKITNDFQNSGSVTYNARARLDVFDGENIVFTGWSQESIMKPGDIKDYTLYWVEEDTEDLTARLRMYFGNEISEMEIEIPPMNDVDSEDAFEVTRVRTFDDTISFYVKSKKDIDNVIIIPENYPLGWIIEQTEIESIESNQFQYTTIDFSTPEYSDIEIDIVIVSKDGTYYSRENIMIKKESGLALQINQFMDSITIGFRSIFG